jgi:hypothetical protein
MNVVHPDTADPDGPGHKSCQHDPPADPAGDLCHKSKQGKKQKTGQDMPRKEIIMEEKLLALLIIRIRSFQADIQKDGKQNCKKDAEKQGADPLEADASLLRVTRRYLRISFIGNCDVRNHIFLPVHCR